MTRPWTLPGAEWPKKEPFHVEQAKIEDGYHWFRLNRDGTTFIALLEEGAWYVVGVEPACDPLTAVDARTGQVGSTYLRPVEPAPHH